MVTQGSPPIARFVYSRCSSELILEGFRRGFGQSARYSVAPGPTVAAQPERILAEQAHRESHRRDHYGERDSQHDRAHQLVKQQPELQPEAVERSDNARGRERDDRKRRSRRQGSDQYALAADQRKEAYDGEHAGEHNSEGAVRRALDNLLALEGFMRHEDLSGSTSERRP